MSIVVSKDDFVGKFGITQRKPTALNPVSDWLRDFLDIQEETILRSLFGDAMYDDFVINHATPFYNDLLTKHFTQDYAVVNCYGCYHDTAILFGLKEMLKGLIYYEYHRSNIRNTAVGQVVNNPETSTVANATQLNSTMYNEAVAMYNGYNQYLNENTATYTLFVSGGAKEQVIFNF